MIFKIYYILQKWSFFQDVKTSPEKKPVSVNPIAKNSSPSVCFNWVWLFVDLFLTSPLAGTDGPVELSAGGLWARGEEGLSFSSTSVVTTSTVSSSCIGVSAEGTGEKSVSKHDALNTPHTSLSNTTATLASLIKFARRFFFIYLFFLNQHLAFNER